MKARLGLAILIASRKWEPPPSRCWIFVLIRTIFYLTLMQAVMAPSGRIGVALVLRAHRIYLMINVGVWAPKKRLLRRQEPPALFTQSCRIFLHGKSSSLR